jgi:TRAP-type mannitol/chloroaromatic compound transport system permease small subunit
MKKVLAFIDALSIWTGKASSWLVFVVSILICYEVTSRFVFRHATLWVTESVVFGCGLSYVLGAAWTLKENRHVKIDMIYDRLSPRQRSIMDSITFVFFATYLGFLLWSSSIYAWRSLLVRETSGSAWDPPIYPIKIALVFSIALLLLQGLAKFIRDLRRAINGTEL